jgi:serine/threonine protein kinase
LTSRLVLAEDWEALPVQAGNEIRNGSDAKAVLALLVKHDLLTTYQAARVEAGTWTLGNYRVLHRIGAGGMGAVFEAEHVRMRRRVAIKVLGNLTARFGDTPTIRPCGRAEFPMVTTATFEFRPRKVDEKTHRKPASRRGGVP